MQLGVHRSAPTWRCSSGGRRANALPNLETFGSRARLPYERDFLPSTDKSKGTSLISHRVDLGRQSR